MTDSQEWRLKAELHGSDEIDDVLDRLRGREQVLGTTVGGALPAGVDLTHSGSTLFVYAATRSTVDSARSAIESLLRTTEGRADIHISRWDTDVEDWRQVEPPLTGEARKLDEARVQAAQRPETRTLTFVVGPRERLAFVASATDFAREAELACDVAEARRWRRTCLTFTVSGPASKVDAFAARAHNEIKRMRWVPDAGGPMP